MGASYQRLCPCGTEPETTTTNTAIVTSTETTTRNTASVTATTTTNTFIVTSTETTTTNTAIVTSTETATRNAASVTATTTTTQGLGWILAGARQSCDDACAGIGKTCVESQLATIDTGSEVLAVALQAGHNCTNEWGA